MNTNTIKKMNETIAQAFKAFGHEGCLYRAQAAMESGDYITAAKAIDNLKGSADVRRQKIYAFCGGSSSPFADMLVESGVRGIRG